MSEEMKVPEVPVPDQKVETPDVPVIDRRRDEAEKAVDAVNNIFIPDLISEKTEEKSNVAEVNKEIEIDDPIERIKKATQKRIDKLTAKSKSAEEELVEARAEIERLKANPKAPDKEVAVNNSPPTPEQVEAYIAKKQEEGDHKEAAAAIRYLVKLEKEAAIKEVQEAQKNSQSQTSAETARQNAAMKDLAEDYVVMDDTGKPDIKSDLTLANQNGLLFKLAMDYFNDKTRHTERYDDPNVVNGFRRAVADAYRDISEHNRTTKFIPKGESTEPKRNSRQVLADPGADFSDESSSTNTSTLSDADKVREEIRNRKKIFQR